MLGPSGDSHIEGGGEKSASCRSCIDPERGIGGGGSGLATLVISWLGADEGDVFNCDSTTVFSSPAKSSCEPMIGLGRGRLASILETVLRGTGGGPPEEGTSISAFRVLTSGKL